jgi:hypothetical protein
MNGSNVTFAPSAQDKWFAVDSILPSNGEVVDTISAGGLQQRLKRNGRLWFNEDGKTYVYYTPVFWRPV